MATAKQRRTKSKPAMPGLRISVDEALKLLLAVYSPHAAAERLYTAWRDNSVRLYCNGEVVTPNVIRSNLLLEVHTEADGRVQAEIGPARIGWDNKPYTFEVDEDEVGALVPPTPKRLKPGRKPKGNWPTLIHRELSRIGRNRVQQLRNSGELRDQLEVFLNRKIGFAPKDPKALNAVIKGFLQG